MIIKMLAGFSGEWSCNPGDVIDRPDKEAIRLIEAGFAEPIRDAAPPVEKAVSRKSSEKAAR